MYKRIFRAKFFLFRSCKRVRKITFDTTKQIPTSSFVIKLHNKIPSVCVVWFIHAFRLCCCCCYTLFSFACPLKCIRMFKYLLLFKCISVPLYWDPCTLCTYAHILNWFEHNCPYPSVVYSTMNNVYDAIWFDAERQTRSITLFRALLLFYPTNNDIACYAHNSGERKIPFRIFRIKFLLQKNNFMYYFYMQ